MYYAEYIWNARACDFFFFNDTATTEIYTLSLHDALPISSSAACRDETSLAPSRSRKSTWAGQPSSSTPTARSEEHTSELQSRLHLVCRLLLEKKKKIQSHAYTVYRRLRAYQHTGRQHTRG